jgi:hypothetical protein
MDSTMASQSAGEEAVDREALGQQLMANIVTRFGSRNAAGNMEIDWDAFDDVAKEFFTGPAKNTVETPVNQTPVQHPDDGCTCGQNIHYGVVPGSDREESTMLICCHGTRDTLKHHLQGQHWLQTQYIGTFVTKDQYWTISVSFPTEAFLPRLHKIKTAGNGFVLDPPELVGTWMAIKQEFARAYTVTDSSVDADNENV